MKITPLDIRRKEFKRSVRGYSDEEVDIFLDEVADEFERLFQENMELQDRMARMDEQIATHAQLKDALEKTLVSAQLQAEELRANAHKERELILRDAEMKARGIVNESYGETHKTQQALSQLKMLEEDFRFKFRSLLEGYLRLLNTAPLAVSGAEPQTLVEAAAEKPEPAVPAPVGPAAEVAAAEPVMVAPEPVVAAAESVPVAAEPQVAPQVASQALPLLGDESPTADTTPRPLSADTIGGRYAASYLEPTVEAPFGPDTLETALPAGTYAQPDDRTGEEQQHGFFFGRRTNDVDDTFQTEDGPRKDKSRDFEW